MPPCPSLGLVYVYMHTHRCACAFACDTGVVPARRGLCKKRDAGDVAQCRGSGFNLQCHQKEGKNQLAQMKDSSDGPTSRLRMAEKKILSLGLPQ